MRRAFASAAVALLAACRAGAPPPPEVRLHATVGDLAVRAVASGAERRGIARVAVVSEGPGAADVGWFGDPTEALEAAGAVVAGAAPAQPDVEPRWKDPSGRFAAVCARARLLVTAPRAPLPFAPASLRDVADPRLAGKVALAPPGAGAGPASFAALSLVYGEASLERFLRL